MQRKISLISALLIAMALVITACSDSELPKRKSVDGSGSVNSSSINSAGEQNAKKNIIVKYKDVVESYELAEGTTFTVSSPGGDFDFVVDSIDGNIISLKVGSYGLIKPNADGTINLRAKEDEFVFSDDEELELDAQIMDASFEIFIKAE